MDIESASHADIGGRDEQQDRVAAFSDRNGQLFVLADGVGGQEGGALAAQTVIDTARGRLDAWNADDPVNLLISVAATAHERINAIGDERGMSPHSTCVLLYIDRNTTAWAHVGDSRLYRFDHGRLAERTIDHSVIEIMRLQGRITEEEMTSHPSRNQLYGALGGRRDPPVDTSRRDTRDYDSYLLASDGLWGNVSETEMETALAARDLAAALRDLTERAKSRGGSECDNLSGVAIRPRILGKPV